MFHWVFICASAWGIQATSTYRPKYADGRICTANVKPEHAAKEAKPMLIFRELLRMIFKRYTAALLKTNEGVSLF